MDPTLAQILNTLAGNSSPNVQPGGVSGARLAFMQGQNPIANQKMAGDVLSQNQNQQALAGMGNINPSTLYPQAGNQNAPQVSPMPGQQVGGGSPAPNPPPVQSQPLPTPGSDMANVPMPGATPMPQVNASVLQPGAGNAPSGPVPPPPSPAQMPQQGQQAAAPQASQVDPQVAQDIHQNMLGPHAPQYTNVIAAVKQAMPNATPQARALAVSEIMKDVNSQTNEVLKQYQQAILTQRLGQSQERMGINEQRLDLAKDKAGLGGGGATDKILDFSAKNAQAKAAGNVGGRTNVARADAEKVLNGPALKAAMAYLPPDQNALEGWIQKQGANFENSPQFKAFKASNTSAAGEIARALAGGGLPKAGLTTEIEGELNNATDQKSYMAVVQSYLATTGAAAGATEDVVKQGGNTPSAGIELPTQGSNEGWKFEKVE